MEGILDHIFVSLGIDNDGGIDRSVLMTETIANLSYTRKSMFLPSSDRRRILAYVL